MVGVAITADSRREWMSRGATRYWIVALGWTDVEIKKPSPAHRQIVDWSFLPEDVRSHKPTYWSGWAFQQRLAQSESLLLEQYNICLSSWQLLVLLLILLLGQLRLHYESARRQTTVTSQTRDFPLRHGTKVSPSGRFPSDRHKPCGSFVFGIAAEERARATSSFKAWCLIDLPGAFTNKSMAAKSVHLCPTMALMGDT